LDSGSSSTIIKKRFIKNLRIYKKGGVKWKTAAGTLKTSEKAKIQFKLDELDESKIIEWNAHVTEQQFSYDMIIGRDLLSELGININFKTNKVEWDDVSIPMKDIDATYSEAYYVEDSHIVNESMERIKRILDAKYEPANLEEIVKNNCSHLSPEEQKSLHELLTKYEGLFDGTLGRWTGEPYDIEVKPNAKPYHARPVPIPKIHEQTL
jgi:predicted aspartyl protease